MSKKYYNPQFMREYRANHTIISNDGLHVERNYMDNGVKKTYEPKIYLDSDSQRNFIETKKVRSGIYRRNGDYMLLPA